MGANRPLWRRLVGVEAGREWQKGGCVSVTLMKPKPPQPAQEPDEMRDFLHVVYRSLKMVVAYLEKRYGF